MAKLTVTPAFADGKWTVTIDGEIDLSSAEAFYAQTAAAYQSQPAPITFDCEKLSFIDSTALGAFVKINRLASGGSHTVTVKGARANVKKLFVICALDKVFGFED